MRQELHTRRDRSRVQQLEVSSRLRGGVVGRIVEAERLSHANLTVLVEFIEAVIRWKGDTEWFRGQINALGPFTYEADVGRHHFERQHLARLDETDHSAETALDVLRALIAKVPEDPLDGATPSERVNPLGRSPRGLADGVSPVRAREWVL